MINSHVPSDIVVGKGSLLMGCDIVVSTGNLQPMVVGKYVCETHCHA